MNTAFNKGQKLLNIAFCFCCCFVWLFSSCSNSTNKNDESGDADREDGADIEAGEEPDGGGDQNADQRLDGGDTSDTDTGHCQSPVHRVRWTFQTPGPTHVLSLAALNDVDSDGVSDVAIAAEHTRSGETKIFDHVFVVSGASLGKAQALWSAQPKNLAGKSGSCTGDECLAASSDLNGDQVPDLLLGTGWDNNTVFALNGASGQTLWMFDTHQETQTGPIQAVASFPDVTGDGRPEVLFGTGSQLQRAFLADGADGRILWRLLDAVDVFRSVRSIADLNSDGFPDVVLAGGDSGAANPTDGIYAVNADPTDSQGNIQYGATASLLWQVSSGWTNQSLAVINDVDGDGLPEVAVAAWGGNVMLLNGATGQTLWHKDDIGGAFTMRVVRLDDLDGDVVDDLAVGGDSPGVLMLSGATGAVLWKGLEPESTWALDRVEDINNDGVNDLVTGSFDGKIRTYDGSNGGLLWEFGVGKERISTIRGIVDVGGDKVPDVLVGTRAQTTGTGSGTVFLLEGCP